MYPIPELAKLMRASLPACSSSEMPCRSTCTLSNTLARSLLYYFRHRLKSSVCRVKGLSAGGTDAHHRPVQEGVDVEHGLQLQGVIHTVVLITIPATETWSGHKLLPRSQPRRSPLLSPVHAAQSQLDVWILEQHSRKKVLLGGIDQERRVYDLQTHTCVFMSTELVLSCDGTPGCEGGELGCNLTFSTLNSSRLASGSHNSFSTLPPTTNRVVTMPISTQEKMKEKPTPLKETQTPPLSCEVNRSLTPCCRHGNVRHQQVATGV